MIHYDDWCRSTPRWSNLCQVGVSRQTYKFRWAWYFLCTACCMSMCCFWMCIFGVFALFLVGAVWCYMPFLSTIITCCICMAVWVNCSICLCGVLSFAVSVAMRISGVATVVTTVIAPLAGSHISLGETCTGNVATDFLIDAEKFLFNALEGVYFAPITFEVV